MPTPEESAIIFKACLAYKVYTGFYNSFSLKIKLLTEVESYFIMLINCTVSLNIAQVNATENCCTVIFKTLHQCR